MPFRSATYLGTSFGGPVVRAYRNNGSMIDLAVSFSVLERSTAGFIEQNCDNARDLVVVPAPNTPTRGAQPTIYVNDGSGQYPTSIPLSGGGMVGYTFETVGSTDFSGDDRRDAYAVAGETLYVWHGQQ